MEKTVSKQKSGHIVWLDEDVMRQSLEVSWDILLAYRLISLF